MSETLFKQRPLKRPVSERFAYRHVLDRYELEMLKHDPDFKEYLKRRMAEAIAQMMVEKCELFEMPDIASVHRGVPIQMEVTVNDRGAYEHLLPQEREHGRQTGIEEGKQRMLESLPYGINPFRTEE